MTATHLMIQVYREDKQRELFPYVMTKMMILNDDQEEEGEDLFSIKSVETFRLRFPILGFDETTLDQALKMIVSKPSLSDVYNPFDLLVLERENTSQRISLLYVLWHLLTRIGFTFHYPVLKVDDQTHLICVSDQDSFQVFVTQFVEKCLILKNPSCDLNPIERIYDLPQGQPLEETQHKENFYLWIEWKLGFCSKEFFSSIQYMDDGKEYSAPFVRIDRPLHKSPIGKILDSSSTLFSLEDLILYAKRSSMILATSDNQHQTQQPKTKRMKMMTAYSNHQKATKFVRKIPSSFLEPHENTDISMTEYVTNFSQQSEKATTTVASSELDLFISRHVRYVRIAQMEIFDPSMFI